MLTLLLIASHLTTVVIVFLLLEPAPSPRLGRVKEPSFSLRLYLIAFANVVWFGLLRLMAACATTHQRYQGTIRQVTMTALFGRGILRS